MGSAPLKTKADGSSSIPTFTIIFHRRRFSACRRCFLDANDPKKIVGEVKRPFLVPEEEYEYYGRVPHIVFPSGALIRAGEVYLYYGATDTVSCVAMLNLADLLEQLVFTAGREMVRFEGNPIMAPVAEHAWESQATFNPAAIFEDGKVRILYRAMSDDNTSVIGYASSADGVHVKASTSPSTRRARSLSRSLCRAATPAAKIRASRR